MIKNKLIIININPHFQSGIKKRLTSKMLLQYTNKNSNIKKIDKNLKLNLFFS